MLEAILTVLALFLIATGGAVWAVRLLRLLQISYQGLWGGKR